MTKFTLIGAVVVVVASALTGPAMAQNTVSHPGSYAHSGVCPGHEAGNPYTREEDYMAWSGWRARGGWDDRNDVNCVQTSRLRYPYARF
jgi:hypothetical protein